MKKELDVNLSRYLSPAELAQFLGISITTIYSYTSDRVIPFTKIGRLVRFNPLEINKWLKQKSVPCIDDLI